MAARRVAKEFKELEKLLGERLWEDPDLGPFTWHLLLDPSPETECRIGPYENVFHGVQIHSVITFPSDYPFKPFRMELDQGWVKAAVERKPGAVTYVRHRNQLSALQDRENKERHALARLEHEELPIPLLLIDTIETETRLRERLARDEEVARSAMPSSCMKALQLHTPSSEGAGPAIDFFVVVKSISGKSVIIPALLHDTIEAIKQRFADKEGYGAHRFIYAGKQLEDGRTLQDYSIALGTTIHAVPYLRGCDCRYLLTPNTSDWTPAMFVEKVVVNKADELYDEGSRPHDYHCDCEKRWLQTRAFGERPSDEVHWYLRCASPSRNVVWSPDNDRYWPMRFRKNIRYLTKISLKGKQVSGSDRIPVDVVAVMGSYL